MLGDLAVAGDQLVDCRKGYGLARRVLVEGYRPFSIAVSAVVGRKHGFHDLIGGERHGNLCRTVCICGAELIRLSGSGIGYGKDRTRQRITVRIHLICHDIALVDEGVIGQMIIRIGIGGFVACLTHPIHTGDFGASVVTHVDDEVHAVVGAGVYGDMLMAVLRVAEDDEVTGGELAAVYIGCTRSDLFNFTFIHKIIQCLLPSNHGLRVPSGFIDGFSDI